MDTNETQTTRTTLDRSVQAFIVQRLACYESPREVVDSVYEEFGIEVTTNIIQHYDPTKSAGSSLGKEWVELFHQTRDNFQRGLYDTGIVWKQYRLKRLDEMERKLRRDGKYTEAAAMLEQAAKEVGGAFDQRRRDGAITLETLQKAIDELATAVVAEVDDEGTLERIEARWGKTMSASQGGTSKPEWGW